MYKKKKKKNHSVYSIGTYALVSINTLHETNTRVYRVFRGGCGGDAGLHVM